ncbi:response regulator transcription factor [Micromonospora cathayae]|uniref:Response regulator transcription factor n=1 Tax=Micromonospora cathayae TaxID=3028804 RepID=A0ABY7ZLA2_9ACTN|nr:response regulator transcription factor [Micromonospora sp. HUAS 3]WDZ83231.1 response regulator transcription factor [Micromonospora sp. HUAS 3]
MRRVPEIGEYVVIRVVVVEEMGLLRGALCAVLAVEEDMEVIADVADVGELPAVVRRHQPDVVVLDLAPKSPGVLDVIEEIAVHAPMAAVLAMSYRWSPSVLEAALAAGARGFIGKDGPLEDLIRMVRSLAAGERVIDPVAAVAVLRPPTCPLTPRELEVLRAASEGLPLKEIARRLFLAHGTVRNHLSAILRKTGARNRVEAIRHAQRDGWL